MFCLCSSIQSLAKNGAKMCPTYSKSRKFATKTKCKWRANFKPGWQPNGMTPSTNHGMSANSTSNWRNYTIVKSRRLVNPQNHGKCCAHCGQLICANRFNYSLSMCRRRFGRTPEEQTQSIRLTQLMGLCGETKHVIDKQRQTLEVNCIQCTKPCRLIC